MAGLADENMTKQNLIRLKACLLIAAMSFVGGWL